jgi:glycosyltransferase involved in cell wall biosynthesis
MSAKATSDRVLPGGLLGYLDDFEYQKTGSDHTLILRGWILGGKSRVRSVIVKQQKGTSLSVPYGQPRPDVAREYPHDPHAKAAGFGGVITLAPSNSRDQKVDICAVLENGREVRCFSRSYIPRDDGLNASGRIRVGSFLRTATQKAIAAYRDGRLSLAPSYWLRGLKAHYYSIVAPDARPDLEQERRNRYRHALKTFFNSHVSLSWPQADPRVSIVLVPSGPAEFTLRCLRGLQGLAIYVDLIIVDNGRSSETSRLLDRLDGVRIQRQRNSASPWIAYNEAARAAKATYVLLLGSDAEVLPGSLESAVKTLESADNIGAVGAKLVLPNGTLKQAGGILWPDGSTSSYGNGDDPHSPAYMYMRDTDYCSSAFLLTRRDLFLDLASTADIDYCVSLRAAGKRVVYDPRVVVNVEPASAKPALEQSHPLRQILDARTASKPRQKVLVLDDRVPHFRHGAGFPRTVELLRTLDALGNFVTFYPVTMPHEDWSEVYEDIPRTVEVITGWGTERLREFLADREGFYDHIVVSRPHNMQTFRAEMWNNGSWATRARVIYDAEAIFSFREAAQRRMAGEEVSESDVARLLSEEMGLTEGVHAVFSVTDKERDYFRTSGVRMAWTLSHIVPLNPTPRSFAERSGFLFVGAMSGMPNRDAVLWFAREIWPGLRPMVEGQPSFQVVGTQPPAEIETVPGIQTLGQVADLTPLYDRARIFVAPSRLAAGIPIKVQTAAANGLPVVCTSILAEELGWQHEVELLVADDPQEFAKCCARLYSDEALWQRLRSNALDRVGRECSQDAFAGTLARALGRSAV